MGWYRQRFAGVEKNANWCYMGTRTHTQTRTRRVIGRFLHLVAQLRPQFRFGG